MLFNSWHFILVFLPITFFVYYMISSGIRSPSAAKIWLLTASLFFYAYWNVAYLPLILLSIFFNYFIGCALSSGRKSARSLLARKGMLALGIFINLAILGVYKYSNFFLENLNLLLLRDIPLPDMVLPLAISFFTFQQIAYLVDRYKSDTKEYEFLRYALFVTFFPQLIAGPIVHHKEIMPQFGSLRSSVIRYGNVLRGLFIFGIGLFKKVLLADTFAIWANKGFDGSHVLDFYSAWATSLSYSFQLYFDFSGYCDMAMGAALLFNVKLPLNFNSPYKAYDIHEFWRRWHITLGRFLRDYLYIPLGGNRVSIGYSYLNVMITFLLGGLWHGASWMFVVWGAMHGIAVIVHRLWRKHGYKLPKPVSWLITFLFVNTAWVFFRAETWSDAARVLHGMVSLDTVLKVDVATIPTSSLAWGGIVTDRLLNLLPTGFVPNILNYLSIVFGFVVLSQQNTFELVSKKIRWRGVCWSSVVFAIGVYFTLVSQSTVFLYFNF